MENKKVTYIKIFFMKERIYWKRMFKLGKELATDLGGILVAYPIILTLISISHYAFAFMHTMLNIYTFIFNRPRFKLNLKNLYGKAYKALCPDNLQMSPDTLNIPEKPAVYGANGRIR